MKSLGVLVVLAAALAVTSYGCKDEGGDGDADADSDADGDGDGDSDGDGDGDGDWYCDMGYYGTGESVDCVDAVGDCATLAEDLISCVEDYCDYEAPDGPTCGCAAEGLALNASSCLCEGTSASIDDLIGLCEDAGGPDSFMDCEMLIEAVVQNDEACW
jgi:hypothetical protein